MKPEKAQIWLAVTLEAKREAVEGALPLLGEKWGGALLREGEDKVEAVFYLSEPERVSQLLEEAQELGCKVLAVEEIPNKDWAEGWKEHFRPLKVGRRFWVYPPWERPSLKSGEIGLVIDPGQAFGTGHHPTTALMLQALEDLGPGLSQKRVLDLGTGTGILAIAAARLGASRVVALDIDPEALRACAHNARLNGVSLEIRDLPLEEWEEEFDLILANISAWELKRLARTISLRATPGGLLFLAGFLRKEMPEMRACYQSLGWQLLREAHREEWGFLAFFKEAR